MASKKIQATKNYRMFTRSDDNRDTNPRKHKHLYESMKEYGYLSSFPIVCFRDSDGRLVVKDGQHRLMIAESLGLPVYWVEEAVDFNIAKVNVTAVTWRLQDYAKMFSRNGKQAYTDGLEFAERHELPVGVAFALLAGHSTFGNLQEQFVAGEFKVKDRKWADTVAGIYCHIVRLSREVSNARFLQACMAVCRVKGFEPDRMLSCAQRCREKLVAYSTREAYLAMLEDIYNFGRQRKVPLKLDAENAMRARNATVASKKKKEAKVSETTAA